MGNSRQKLFHLDLQNPPNIDHLLGVERRSELESFEVGELDVREVGAVPERVSGDRHVAAAAQGKVLRLPRQTALADLQVGLENDTE